MSESEDFVFHNPLFKATAEQRRQKLLQVVRFSGENKVFCLNSGVKKTIL